MELPPPSMERLKAVRDKTEATSSAKVVKNALKLYDAMIEKSEAGNESLIKDKNRVEHHYQVFY